MHIGGRDSDRDGGLISLKDGGVRRRSILGRENIPKEYFLYVLSLNLWYSGDGSCEL